MLRQQQIQRLVQYQLDGKIHVDKVMRTARYNINLINRKKTVPAPLKLEKPRSVVVR